VSTFCIRANPGAVELEQDSLKREKAYEDEVFCTFWLVQNLQLTAGKPVGGSLPRIHLPPAYRTSPVYGVKQWSRRRMVEWGSAKVDSWTELTWEVVILLGCALLCGENYSTPHGEPEQQLCDTANLQDRGFLICQRRKTDIYLHISSFGTGQDRKNFYRPESRKCCPGKWHLHVGFGHIFLVFRQFLDTLCHLITLTWLEWCDILLPRDFGVFIIWWSIVCVRFLRFLPAYN
jgi:hypothetical protein